LDNNFNIPKSLRDALVTGEVVPFVGAGVSMTVKKKNDDGTESGESLFPSWKGFVEILAQALHDENKSDEADYVLSSIKIKKPKYLDALQHAQEQLGKSLWYKLFDESFDIPESKAYQESLKLNELVWQLSNNLIITTNVDRVFQWTCPQPSEFKLLDVQNVEYAQLQKEQIPKRPTVWYLHGHIDHKEKVIFTREQFEAFYKQRDNDAKLQTLLNFLTQRTFLFIGFSLDDAYLREQLEYIHKIYKGGADSFYILLRERDIANADLPEYVKPIPFSDFGKPLEDLVAELARIAKGDDNAGKVKSNDDLPNTPTDSKSDVKKPFFNVQYNSKGKEFVGRIGKMEEIWSLLNKEGCASIGQAVSVKGFGGLGKTQLAVEYAHAYRDKYKKGVFWVVADENIDNQLLQIAIKCGWINQFDKTVNQLDVAKAKFLALSDCLILVDNVESFDDVKDYLPKTDLQTHLLITSRYKDRRLNEIDIDLLSADESRTLLEKVSRRNPTDESEKAELEQILKILGGIPLAIELVGGFLSEHPNITFAKYHQYLNEVPLDKLEKEFSDGSFTDHDCSIIRTLRISKRTIEEKPLMVEILKVLAWSGSSSMGTSLLQALVEAENDFVFDTALGDAHKLRLLKKDEDAERYAIHRLLAKVIRHEEPLDAQQGWHEKLVRKLENWFSKCKIDFNYLAEFESEIEHLIEWQHNTTKLLPKQSIWLIALESHPIWERGNYYEALKILEKSLKQYETEKLNNGELLASIKNDLGVFYGAVGKYQKALEFQEEALELHKKLFGEMSSSTATSYHNVGLAYGQLGRNLEALKYKKKALEIQIKLFGEKHPSTATSYGNISITYGDLGKHYEALECQEKALKIQIELFGEKHPATAVSYINLGEIYRDLGEHYKALKHKKKGLIIEIGVFGEKHPVTAISYNNIGGTYSDLGKYQEALDYHQKALEIHQKLLGEQHPNTVVFATNLIDILLKLGNKEKAGRKAAEFFSYVPQNHHNWKWFEEISRPYRSKKKRHKKR
jgi:tetratricopeptide (TPR) repeat protein